MKKNHVVYVTIYGDDWTNEERYIVHSMKEVEYYKSEEYKQEQLKINGIESIAVETESYVSQKRLREILTVDEFCEVFPEIKVLLDNHFEKKSILNIEVGKEYRIINNPRELGPQHQWLLGQVVEVVGEKNSFNKYPIVYDSSLIPVDGFSRPATAVREDLLEEL